MRHTFTIHVEQQENGRFWEAWTDERPDIAQQRDSMEAAVCAVTTMIIGDIRQHQKGERGC